MNYYYYPDSEAMNNYYSQIQNFGRISKFKANTPFSRTNHYFVDISTTDTLFEAVIGLNNANKLPLLQLILHKS